MASPNMVYEKVFHFNSFLLTSEPKMQHDGEEIENLSLRYKGTCIEAVLCLL